MSDGRYAGVDWAGEEHAVCVVDERGRIVEGRRYRHNETGIRALCARLLRLKVQLVAIERPDRAAAGRGADSCCRASQSGQGDAPALQRGGWQERQL
jgi:hypothetical protein